MEYFNIGKEELGENSSLPLLKLGESGEVFYEIALRMVKEIEKNNEKGENTVFIVPVGPVGQYPIFVRLVNERRLSLKNTYFFNMDEYLTDDKEYIDKDHRLSFRGFMDREVYGRIDKDLVMDEDHRIFPDPKNPDKVYEKMKDLGGVDICFGGIGITGHLAFNEPEDMDKEEFKKLSTRVLEISRETRTVNSIGDLNGAISAMPKYAITLGMKEILSSRKIVIGVFRDWHRAVVRQTLYGEVSAKFPATLLRDHTDAIIIANDNASQKAF
ncbi:MAG: glucosamine-6-phosphate isomerase [Anaerococcus sp.]|nr:glucosamine-6-phosphate isomerase [Anaerococcus sp.]